MNDLYAALLDKFGQGRCPPHGRMKLEMTPEYGPALVARRPGGAITSACPLPPIHNAFLGAWVTRSPFPGTPPWEWVVSNMPVTVVTGMSSGYCWTRRGARREARRALRFWKELGYRIDLEGTQRK